MPPLDCCRQKRSLAPSSRTSHVSWRAGRRQPPDMNRLRSVRGLTPTGSPFCWRESNLGGTGLKNLCAAGIGNIESARHPECGRDTRFTPIPCFRCYAHSLKQAVPPAKWLSHRAEPTSRTTVLSSSNSSTPPLDCCQRKRSLVPSSSDHCPSRGLIRLARVREDWSETTCGLSLSKRSRFAQSQLVNSFSQR